MNMAREDGGGGITDSLNVIRSKHGSQIFQPITQQSPLLFVVVHP